MYTTKVIYNRNPKWTHDALMNDGWRNLKNSSNQEIFVSYFALKFLDLGKGAH